MRKIQAGLRTSEVTFDPETEAFVSPVIWEIKGGECRNFVIHVHTQGWSEHDLRHFLGWSDVDDDTDSVKGRATARYFKKHSVREVLVGDNPCVSVKSIKIDDCGFLYADLEIKRKLQIYDQMCLNSVWVELIFDIVVWDELGQPIEKYLIRCPSDSDDTFITVFKNNGGSIDKWPIKEEIQILAPKLCV